MCNRQWCFIDLRRDVVSGRTSMVWEAVLSVVYWLVSSWEWTSLCRGILVVG